MLTQPLEQPIHRILDLISPDRRAPAGCGAEEVDRLLFETPEGLAHLDESFALVARRGVEVRMARSLDRPVRYFLAKEGAGPYLIVAERIDEIRACLEREGHAWQFHPTYTRMVPAHHVTRIELVGCPDPSPTHLRFFTPAKDVLPADRREIGRRYVRAVYDEVRSWIARLPASRADRRLLLRRRRQRNGPALRLSSAARLGPERGAPQGLHAGGRRRRRGPGAGARVPRANRARLPRRDDRSTLPRRSTPSSRSR